MMHQLVNDALDLMEFRLGGSGGYDGKWKWVSPRDQQPVEVFLAIEEPESLYLHVSCNHCPLKFTQVRSVRQLEMLLDYVLGQCRPADR